MYKAVNKQTKNAIYFIVLHFYIYSHFTVYSLVHSNEIVTK